MNTIRRAQTLRTQRSHKSRILTDEENMCIHRLLKTGCVSLVTTVAEMYVTRPPNHNVWFKECVGVLCLVKNSANHEYRFYLYSLEFERSLWHCSVDNTGDYWAGMSFFHMFLTENYVVGFNFANEVEADYLKSIIRNELQSTAIDSKFVITPKPIKTTTTRKSIKKKKGEKLNISEPVNFVHVAHVNLSRTGEASFNTSKEDQYINEIFKLAGIKEEQIQNPEMNRFMVKFIKKSRKKYQAPQPPQDKQILFVPSASSQPSSPSRKAPPRPPSRNNSVLNSSSRVIPKAMSVPLPPPLPLFNTDEEMSTNFSIPNEPISDHRANFLESIRKGSTLRSVKEREIPRVDDEDFYKNDLAAALSKAIRIREIALQNYESYSETEEELDDGEWEI